MTSHAQTLHRRIHWLTWVFILGLVVSGATAIPLGTELNWLVRITHADSLAPAPGWAARLMQVKSALEEVQARHPFLFYGTDWLAFGHFVIAIAFAGALRNPVRNRWLFAFGLIACGLVIPYALVFGGVRGIPVWWRLLDCSFGILGFLPLWLCWRWSGQLERLQIERRLEPQGDTDQQGRG